jgi:hypothetical protein
MGRQEAKGMSRTLGNESRRIQRERRTIRAMIAVYCRGHRHGAGPVCPECQGLLDYALARLDRCPFGPEKTTCANCPIHCYKPDMRQRVRDVMRYAGPRMMLRHPVLALLHSLDGLMRKPKLLPRKGKPGA